MAADTIDFKSYLDMSIEFFTAPEIIAKATQGFSNNKSIPFFAHAIISYLIFRERVGKKALIGIIIIIAILVSWSINFNFLGILEAFSPGIVLILLGCACWGVDNNVAQTLGEKSSMQTASIKGLVGGGISMIIAFIIQARVTITLMQFSGILLVSLLSFSISIVMFLSALKYIGTINTAIAYSLAPFIGSILSIFINRDAANVVDFGVFFIALAGILLIMKDKHEHYHEHEKLCHTHEIKEDDVHHVDKNVLIEGYCKDTYKGGISHVHLPVTHCHGHLHDLHHRHPHEREKGDEEGQEVT